MAILENSLPDKLVLLIKNTLNIDYIITKNSKRKLIE